MQRSFWENASDIALFFLATLPFVLEIITNALCTGWNTGTMSGTCTVPALEGIYNVLTGLLFFFVVGGFFFVLPVILIALVVTIVAKIRRYARGYTPDIAEIILELLTIIPVMITLYLLFLFFVPEYLYN